MQPRTVGLIAVLSLAAGWLTSTIVSPSRSLDPRSTAAADTRGPRPLGRQADPAPFTQQLRLKLQEHPRSPSPGRNPFVFGSRRSVASRANERASEIAPPAAAPPVVANDAPPLRFSLTGVATNRTDGGEVFTAILNDNGSLVFAKAGDKLSNGYTVIRVEETAVIIADAAGVEQTLRLK